MKLAQALVAMGLVISMTAPAAAQITPIDDIQLYSNTGVPSSPFNNQIVTVRGVVTALKGTWNSGTHYLQDATGGMNFFDPGAPTFAIGDEIEVTGTVTAFSGEINLSCPCTYNFLGSGAPPAPIVYTVGEFVDNDGSGTRNSADYEILGWLATVSGTVAYRTGDAALPFDQGTFSLTDGTTDTLTVFIDRDTGIDTSGLLPGTEVQVIGPVSVFNFNLQLKPRFQLDVIINPGNPAPQISNVVPNPWTPVASQSITVSATITDNGSIATATLYYRDKGAGTFNSVPMSNVGGDTYSGVIPGTTATGVEYYVEASDDTAQFTTLPGSAPAAFLQLAVGTTSIVTIQSTIQPGSPTGASALVGERVNIEAIVTVAPGELQVSGLSNYVVGEASGGPWSGVFIFEGTGSNILFRGDRVRIAGRVDEFNGITEVIPISGQAVELVSFGNPLPPVTQISTSVMDTTEAWESVIVSTFRAAVVDTSFGGTDWRLQDATSDSSIYVAPAPGASYVATLGEEMFVTGFLDTRFGTNDLVPRDNVDITQATSTPEGNVPRADVARFESIVPNPFNPSTKISYTVPAKGQIELAIFDARGRRVNTLVSGSVEAGTHAVTWTGLDAEGGPVSSGVYYVRLRDGLRSVSVEKVTLSK